MSLKDDLKLALDPVEFAKMLDITPDPWQEQVLRWTGKKLLLNCSRQSGKSLVSSLLATHRIIYQPGALVLIISPSQRQSGLIFKTISDLLKRLPVAVEMTEENRLSLTLKNGSRLVSLPSSESTVRGYSGASLIVIDEASRVPDGLYFSALTPMVAVSGGQILILSTPAGCRGFFYEAYLGDEFEKLTVTAENCPRIDADWLQQQRDIVGDFVWKTEYFCEFMQNEDSLFTIEQINDCFTDSFDGWNFNMKGDYITIGEDN